MAIDFAKLRKELYTAVLSDTLDALGHTHQAMKPFVRPLDDRSVLFGRARTGLFMPIYHIPEGENFYELEIRLIDDLKPDEVAVFACNGPTDRIAPWGELLS
ncbi:MAG: RraA family protein, partial [Geminicoccaceae bacterium]